MLKINEYFEGNVKSISHESAEGTATIGVMAKGEYEFGTSAMELVTVISGIMNVQQPGSKVWKSYKKFETFVVEKNVKFKVKCEKDTPYFCLYK
jgi:purine/pyrimidine-nucleoside phosphorylase